MNLIQWLAFIEIDRIVGLVMGYLNIQLCGIYAIGYLYLFIIFGI